MLVGWDFDAVALAWALGWGSEFWGGAALGIVDVGDQAVLVNDDGLAGKGTS